MSRPGTNAAFAPRLEGPGDPGLPSRRRVPGRPASGLAAVGGDWVPLGADLRACDLPSASASGQRHSIEAQRPAMVITLTHSLGERHPDRLLPYGQVDTQLVLTLQHCDSCWWHVLNCGIALQLQVMESRPVQCRLQPRGGGLGRHFIFRSARCTYMYASTFDSMSAATCGGLSLASRVNDVALAAGHRFTEMECRVPAKSSGVWSLSLPKRSAIGQWTTSQNTCRLGWLGSALDVLKRAVGAPEPMRRLLVQPVGFSRGAAQWHCMQPADRRCGSPACLLRFRPSHLPESTGSPADAVIDCLVFPRHPMRHTHPRSFPRFLANNNPRGPFLTPHLGHLSLQHKGRREDGRSTRGEVLVAALLYVLSVASRP